MRDVFFRGGKPQTYAQAWLAAAITAVLVGASFSAIGALTNWETPWPQFAVVFPAWCVVLFGLRSSYDVRRRRASTHTASGQCRNSR